MLLIYLIKIGLVQTASCEELMRTERADAKGKGDNFPVLMRKRTGSRRKLSTGNFARRNQYLCEASTTTASLSH